MCNYGQKSSFVQPVYMIKWVHESMFALVSQVYTVIFSYSDPGTSQEVSYLKLPDI